MNASLLRFLILFPPLSLLSACALWNTPIAHFENDFDRQWQAAADEPRVSVSTGVLAGELAAQRGMTHDAAEYYVAAARISTDAEVARRATQLALQAEDSELGEQAAERWIALDQENTGAFEIGARLALRAGNNELALQRLQGLLELDQSEESNSLINVAEILALEAGADEAMALFYQLAGQQPQTAQLAYAEALLAQRLDRQQQAGIAVARALELRPDWQAAQLLALRLQLDAGNGEAVEASIRDLHVNNPGSLQLRLSLGSLLLEFEQVALARREFQSALKIESENASALYALGLIEMDEGHLDKAQEYFTTLQNNGERMADSSFYLGRIAEQRGQILQAMQFYREVRSGRRVLDAAIRQAVIISAQGNHEASRQYLQTLRSRFPQQELRLWQVEAELLYRANENEAALEIYDQLIVEYADDVDLRYGRAIVYERLGEIDKAERDLQQIIQADPEDARSLNALGYMLSNHTDRYAEATDLVRKALALTPDDPAVIDSLGWLYFLQGDLVQARVYLEKAWASLKDPEVAAHLGEVLWRQGARQRAQEIWRRGLTADPNHKVLRETMNRLMAEQELAI